MDINTSKLVLAAAGSGGAGDSVYVDDLFSTFLYDGTGNAQTIVNGIDLAGEGGMVIQRRRNVTGHWFVNDTENGANNFIYTNLDNSLGVGTSGSSFNSNGFTIGAENNLHALGNEVASWTFRKAPGFFDIVKYSGTGSVQNIAHSLGSTPGMIIIRCLIGTHDWEVYHRSTGPTVSFHINHGDSPVSDSSVWNNTSPTSTQFTVGTNNNVNQNGHIYIAYIFAHDQAEFGTDANESIIKCGSYTGNVNNQIIDLGFEPQWILLKNTNSGASWYLIDSMRGMSDASNSTAYFFPNGDGAENLHDYMQAVPNGFQLTQAGGGPNDIGTFIYMAIRRPNKPPETASDVFFVNYHNNDAQFINAGFPVDFAITANRDHTYGNILGTRLTGKNYLYTALTSWRDPSGYADTWTSNTKFRFVYAGSGYDWANFAFRRAPGCFDALVYDGDSNANRQVHHNLGVKPEMIIIKNTSYSSGTNWTVWHKGIFDTQLSLNQPSGWANNGPSSTYGGTGYGTSTGAKLLASTSSYILPGNAFLENSSGERYTALLFATLPNISKVGSYTGTGSDMNIDCGFTAGARFVMIKRADSTADWFVWDSVRGITSGNDPYIKLNQRETEKTNTNHIDPYNSGFRANANDADINTNGGTYIFLAIA